MKQNSLRDSASHHLEHHEELSTSLAALLSITVSNLQSLEQRLGVDLSPLQLLAKDCVSHYAASRGVRDSDVASASRSLNNEARRFTQASLGVDAARRN
jgi:hypothetical protein